MNANHDANDDANRDASQDCAAFADELTHLVLGELEPARAAAVEAHCASCAACRAERELLAKSAELIEADAPKLATVMRLSEAREQALLAQAAAGVGPRKKFWTLERLAAAAAAILTVCVTGNWLWRKYDRAPQWSQAVAEKYQAPTGTGAFAYGPGYTPVEERAPDWQAAAEGNLDKRKKDGAQPQPTQLAALSLDAAQKEQEQAARVVRGQVPATDPLGDATTVTLERNAKVVEEKLETDDVAKSAETLKQLGEVDEAEAAPESKVELKKFAGGRAMGAGARKGQAPSRPAAPPPEATTLSDEDRDRLRALGYIEEAEPEFESRLQIGDHLYVLDDTVSGATSGAAITREQVLEKQRELELLGFAGDSKEAIPDPNTGYPSTVYDFPDVVITEEVTRSGRLAIGSSLATTAFHTPRDVATLEDQLRRAAAAGQTVDVDALVKSFLDRLAPRQGEAPRDMFFRWFGDNPSIPTRIDARSTFGMEVDSASYNLARAYLAKGTLPPKAAVRTEEFVNAFKQGLAAPAATVDGVANPDVFALTTELAPSPFGEGKQLLRVGLKAREIDRTARPPATLTFVIDVSGSMEEGGRLELVKQALRLLVAQLDERDSIAVVVFSENARIALPPTRASEQAKVLAALDPLRPEQSTNAGAGLRLGYDLAMTQRDRAGDHRVILCSDGVANAGVTDPDQMTARIRQCKSERIYLTTVGVGMNNVNDALLEQLAREGDGNCHYVDGLAEAKELFVDKLTGTLSTVARDAKIQVEFEPQAVRAFRQLGYENRAIAHADFRNDKVDAGEVGAGHEVVALYELDLAPGAAGPIAKVSCRYEEPRSQTVREQARVCFAADAVPTVAAASPRWRLDAAVAEFAELLRQSVHARDGSFGAIERLSEPLVAELADDKDVPEFVALVKQAARLPDLLPRRGELSRCVDELKKVRCWQQEFGQSDPAQQQANGDLMRQLEEQNRKLEQALRDALANAARGR